MPGDGSGKWRLEVVSEQAIVTMSLLESPTDHLTNLSTIPPVPKDGRYAVPLFPAAGDASRRQGFLRVVNRSENAGEVRIEAFDETDWDYEPLTLSIGGGETVRFNSDDLEQGSPHKGLSGGTGAADGDWRLELTAMTGSTNRGCRIQGAARLSKLTTNSRVRQNAGRLRREA